MDGVDSTQRVFLAKVTRALAFPSTPGMVVKTLLEEAAAFFGCRIILFRRHQLSKILRPVLTSIDALEDFKYQRREIEFDDLVNFSHLIDEYYDGKASGEIVSIDPRDIKGLFDGGAPAVMAVSIHLGNEEGDFLGLFVGSCQGTALCESCEILDPLTHFSLALKLALRGYQTQSRLTVAERKNVVVRDLAHFMGDELLDDSSWLKTLISGISSLLRVSNVNFYSRSIVGEADPTKDRFGSSVKFVMGERIAATGEADWESLNIFNSIDSGIETRRPSDCLTSRKGINYSSIEIRFGLERINREFFIRISSARHLRFDLGEILILEELVALCRIGLELRHAQSDLVVELERNRYLALALDQAVEGICIYDMDLGITYANQSFLELHGYKRSEISGLHSRDFYDESTPDDVLSYLLDRVDNEERIVTDVLRRRKDGSKFQATVLLGSIRDRHGMVVGRMATVLDASEQAKTIELLKQQADRDPLTGLFNRRHLMNELTRVLGEVDGRGNPKKVGVIFIDLDHFKSINDTFGHDAGDELLRVVSIRLNGALRLDDMAGRIGGDEFLVLLPGVGGLVQASRIAKRIAANLFDDPVAIGERTIRFAASMGVAVGTAADSTAEQLVKVADTMMYRSKATSKGISGERTRTNRPLDMALADHELGELLELAIADPVGCGLGLHYRPVFDVFEGSVVALLASIEWQHPKVGYISQARLESAASVTRHSWRIFWWYLTTAFDEWNDLALHDGVLYDLNLSLTIPDKLILDEELSSAVERNIFSGGVRANNVVLEIDEAALNGPLTDEVARVIQKMGDLGLTLALGDFGLYCAPLKVIDLPISIYKVSKPKRSVPWADNEGFLDSISRLARSRHGDVMIDNVDSQSDFNFARRYTRYCAGNHLGRSSSALSLPRNLERYKNRITGLLGQG
ncbi:diguanylate cyclase [Acidithrix sp. C25]|uniref:diguanylate cyclase n=1 Tax=Acidithrix sp. C25 TaxID=1671482 RepID=UPI00191B997E|nr:diguanylate cyclase [Acidithrix sp. C25]CAG4904892.1 unnamed protein product [Acidithrix sp. C25]